MQNYTFEAMGTVMSITIWDTMSLERFNLISRTIENKAKEFEKMYSRFLPNTELTQFTQRVGEFEVSLHLVAMLRIYEKLFELSDYKVTPLIGGLLEDVGYDVNKTLVPKETKRLVPSLKRVLRIIDDTHIETTEKIFLDFGAVGKGYFVDLMKVYLQEEGVERFLMNGSGDVYYEGFEPIRVGLEDPDDTTKVVGVVNFSSRAMCSSATNKRKWDRYNHYVDPNTRESPDYIKAVWVVADSAAWADGIASVLFFVPAEQVRGVDFEYCVLNSERKIKHSAGFSAELF